MIGGFAKDWTSPASGPRSSRRRPRRPTPQQCRRVGGSCNAIPIFAPPVCPSLQVCAEKAAALWCSWQRGRGGVQPARNASLPLRRLLCHRAGSRPCDERHQGVLTPACLPICEGLASPYCSAMVAPRALTCGPLPRAGLMSHERWVFFALQSVPAHPLALACLSSVSPKPLPFTSSQY